MEKLYVNENFPMPVVNYLRLLGYDVLTSLEAGNANHKLRGIKKRAKSKNKFRKFEKFTKFWRKFHYKIS